MSQENTQQQIQEDEIDLRELWKTLVKRKMLIAAVTLAVTIAALAYALLATPIYSGSVLIEIGEVINDVNDVNNVNDVNDVANKVTSLSRVKLDDVENLQFIVGSLLGIEASIPKKTGLLILSSSGHDKAAIRTSLEDAVSFIDRRHHENVKLYSSKSAQIKMTKVVGSISVGQEPVKPKKKLIVVVAFVTGLMLSVFLAFFLEFIQGSRREEL